MSEPIKRIEALKSISRDHHHGLLLCWKIREGVKRNIEAERVKKYVDWFWHNHLAQHIEKEEKLLFPILGNQNNLIKQALDQHRRLKQLFESVNDLVKSLNLIEEELEKHIRFEERTLFSEIQKVANEKQLQQIQSHHSDSKFEDNLTDPFWI